MLGEWILELSPLSKGRQSTRRRRKGVGHDICARLYFNNTYRRSGTPWVGRYSATVVDRERYRLDVIRYLALNPARAGRVEELKIWPREAVTLLPEALES